VLPTIKRGNSVVLKQLPSAAIKERCEELACCIMLLFSVGCFVYKTECPCGFQNTHQQLQFPYDLRENIGRYFRSPLAIRIGEIHVFIFKLFVYFIFFLFIYILFI
jgi:hypothetical protein